MRSMVEGAGPDSVFVAAPFRRFAPPSPAPRRMDPTASLADRLVEHIVNK